jgi:hypothetical protein
MATAMGTNSSSCCARRGECLAAWNAEPGHVPCSGNEQERRPQNDIPSPSSQCAAGCEHRATATKVWAWDSGLRRRDSTRRLHARHGRPPSPAARSVVLLATARRAARLDLGGAAAAAVESYKPSVGKIREVITKCSARTEDLVVHHLGFSACLNNEYIRGDPFSELFCS